MGLRVTLDTTILQDLPRGWDGAKYKSKRDADIKGLFTIYVTDLEFWGDGFDYIDNVMNQNYCQTIEVLIESDDCESGVWVEEFNGIIKLTEISKIKLDERLVRTKIFDQSFGARINNNKSLKAYVKVGTSKNGLSITPAPAESIEMFDPSANFETYLGTTRDMHRAWNCFHFIIQYMTDGEVDFISDVFDVGGDYYNTWITNGSELRFGNGTGWPLELSFKTLFKELDKKYNLSFAIEPNPASYSNAYRVRVEPTSYFEEENANLTLEDIRGMDMDFNKEALYSDVNIGSDNFDDDIQLSYPPLNFKTFREENYTILGQCNVDKTLDLVSEWIIDTNVIEDILLNNEAKYDDKNFIIIGNGNNQAIKTKPYGEPVSIGITDSTTANKLVDSTADFVVDGVVAGDMIENLDTNELGYVVAVDSLTTLSVSPDIFPSSTNYTIKTQPYSYNEPINNYNCISRYLGGLPNSVVKYLSTSSTANFWAAKTNTTTLTTFPFGPVTVNFSDDSTSPFFDDGNNYNTTSFYYDIPASGLYGFLAKLCLRIQTDYDTANTISNGDFSTLPQYDWQYNFGNISGGEFSFSLAWYNASIAYLRQSAFQSGYSYKITFDLTITEGSVIVLGQTFSTSGTHTIYADFRNSTSIPPLEFNYATSQGGNVIGSIDNVVVNTQGAFVIQTSMQRMSAANTVLQAFNDVFNIPFGPSETQRFEILETQRTFPTFKNERIRLRVIAEQPFGSNGKIDVLPSNQLISSDLEYTSFKTISVDDGGGDILPVEPSTFPIYKYEFKKALTLSQWNALKDDPKTAILFSNTNSNHLFGWRNSIEYDRKTGETEFVLRSKEKINTDCQ